MKQCICLAAGALMVQLATGQTATWISVSGGSWTNAANWQGGVLPGAGTDASINANGTYTNTVAGTAAVQNVTLGTTSASGTQMVQMSSSVASMLGFSNFTVGSRGVFAYADNSSMPGTGLVTVVSGGQLSRFSGQNQGNFADHDLRVQPGGRWTIASGARHNVSSNAKDVTYTIDGTLEGAGSVDFNNKDARTWLTGTGQINVAQITFNGNNGNLYLGGALTVNGMINESNGNNCASILTNGTTLTLNGPYYMQSGGNMFFLLTNNDAAVVTGTNLISIVHSTEGSASTLGGFKTTGATTGTLTIAGTGLLDICQAGTNYAVVLGCPVLNLLRDAHFWGKTNTVAPIKQGSGPITLNVSGSTLTLDTNCFLRFWRGNNLAMNVTNGATLVMRQAVFEGNGGPTATILAVGNGSPGTLSIQSSNIFRRSSDNSAAPYQLTVLLGTNAIVNAGAGSVLRIQDAYVAIGITNVAAWGWKRQGALEIYSNAIVEAMSRDRGANVDFESVGFGIRDFRIGSGAGANSMTVTLWNAGAPFNDQNGTTDTALYVRSLDITGFSGTNITLSAGTAVPAGKQRLYYQRLFGGTASQLGPGFVPLTPHGTAVLFF